MDGVRQLDFLSYMSFLGPTCVVLYAFVERKKQLTKLSEACLTGVDWTGEVNLTPCFYFP